MAMTDEELVRSCRAGDSAACNVLFEKYKPLVKSRAANKYLSGGEYDDLIQEGMIGLLAAVNDYDPVKAEGAKFGTFATLCIDRQLMHAIESARSRKNRVLSESVPMDAGDMDKVLTAADPEKMVPAAEGRKEKLAMIRGSLSRLEMVVLNMMLQGYSTREIASMLGKSPKAVDNAFQRIRRKTKRVLEGEQ